MKTPITWKIGKYVNFQSNSPTTFDMIIFFYFGQIYCGQGG